MKQERLHLVPVSVREASEYVAHHHRTHKPPRGAILALAVSTPDGEVHGVAMLGRPVARELQDGWTVEVTRVATDETPNACSFLYGAARRAAAALGYRRVVTYTMEREPGTSLTAAGWAKVATVRGRSWDAPSRRRFDPNPTDNKLRWEVGA